MKLIIKIILISAAIAALCSCVTSSPKELPVLEILHNFNWLGDDGNHKNAFDGKPFLNKNADGSNAAAGVFDVTRDGEPEFLLAVYHAPRGIPSVEVFTIRNNNLISLGGFFEGREQPLKLSYYKDAQGRQLFLHETESHYGGIVKTLVATYTDDFSSIPVACAYSHYDDKSFPGKYYVFTDDKNIECTNRFLSGGLLDSISGYEVTEEEYKTKISEFMETLTWVEDARYDYTVYYHLYNSHEFSNEIRGGEIAEGLEASPPIDFYTAKEVKKTSDMVADKLYAAYRVFDE